MLLGDRKMELFEPLKVMVSDAQKAKKQRLISDPKLTWCEILLARDPREKARIGVTRLTADVGFDLEELLALPNDENTSGPYTVAKLRSALPILETTNLVDVETIADAIDRFEEDGYRHQWTLKNSRLGKRDFRIKLVVSEYPGHECVWAEVSSEQLGISEAIEVFHQEKFAGRNRGAFPEWSGEYTRHGGLYNVRRVSLTPEGLKFGSDDAFCFSTTFGRQQLTTELSDALGLAP